MSHVNQATFEWPVTTECLRTVGSSSSSFNNDSSPYGATNCLPVVHNSNQSSQRTLLATSIRVYHKYAFVYLSFSPDASPISFYNFCLVLRLRRSRRYRHCLSSFRCPCPLRYSSSYFIITPSAFWLTSGFWFRKAIARFLRTLRNYVLYLEVNLPFVNQFINASKMFINFLFKTANIYFDIQ